MGEEGGTGSWIGHDHSVPRDKVSEKRPKLILIRKPKAEANYHDLIRYCQHLPEGSVHQLGPREVLRENIPLARRDDVRQITCTGELRVLQNP